jgi:tight adherence protein B
MIAPLLGLAVAALVLVSARPRHRRTPEAAAGPITARPLRESAEEVLDRLLPSRRDRRRDRQLPDALDRLGSSLRAGEAIGPALVGLSRHAPDPLGLELRGLARRIERGRSVEEALAGWSSSDRASRDVRLVAAALTVGAGSGGEVARAVDGIAATLRERHEVAAEAHALATQARASAALLVTAPFLFTALVAMVEPGAIVFLLTTPVGLMCLLLGVGLDAVGAAWMARITRGAAG